MLNVGDVITGLDIGCSIPLVFPSREKAVEHVGECSGRARHVMVGCALVTLRVESVEPALRDGRDELPTLPDAAADEDLRMVGAARGNNG